MIFCPFYRFETRCAAYVFGSDDKGSRVWSTHSRPTCS